MAYNADWARRISDPCAPAQVARDKAEYDRELQKCLDEVKEYAEQGFYKVQVGILRRDVRKALKSGGYRITHTYDDGDGEETHVIHWNK